MSSIIYNNFHQSQQTMLMLDDILNILILWTLNLTLYILTRCFCYRHAVVCTELPWSGDPGLSEEFPDCAWQWWCVTLHYVSPNVLKSAKRPTDWCRMIAKKVQQKITVMHLWWCHLVDSCKNTIVWTVHPAQSWFKSLLKQVTLSKRCLSIGTKQTKVF